MGCTDSMDGFWNFVNSKKFCASNFYRQDGNIKNITYCLDSFKTKRYFLLF